MMILRYSPASPYARKIRIAAELLGLSERIRIESASTADPNDSLRIQNPLGKIPTLILADGSSLYDSRVIADYLDHLSGGGKLIPADPDRRFAALRLQALAQAGRLPAPPSQFQVRPRWPLGELAPAEGNTAPAT